MIEKTGHRKYIKQTEQRFNTFTVKRILELEMWLSGIALAQHE
jgi:hypothetical protein